MKKVSYSQLTLLSLISLIYFSFKKYDIFTGLLISSLASFFFIQLLRFSANNKIFALFGFPIRLILIAPIAAILVHKLHSNLIALFTGFVFAQLIYFVFVWIHVKKEIRGLED